MKCPVCKNELPANPRKCEICGFSRLNVEFYSVESATNWVESVVLPYREQWQRKKTQCETQKGTDTYTHYNRNSKADPTDFEFTFDERGAILTKYLKYGFKSCVYIPETVYGRNVYYLGDNLFNGCKEIDTVYIPSSVQIIGNHSFQNTAITTLILPPYLKAIGSFAFCGTNLQEITLPNCVSFIGEGALKNTNISNLCFPEYVKKIPRGVCSDCHNLKQVTILGAEDLSAYAFSSCHNLEELLLPETLVTISDDKEYPVGNKNITMYSPLKLRDTATLILPKSLESIYIGSSMPARTIVAKNDCMEWNEDSGFEGFGDFGDIFGSLFGGTKSIIYTIYCIPGSTSHEFSRKKGYNVKHLSDFSR